METLPNEILLHIFNFAIGYNEVKTYIYISITCRLFNNVSKLHTLSMLIQQCIKYKRYHQALEKIIHGVAVYEHNRVLRSHTALITNNIPYLDKETVMVKNHHNNGIAIIIYDNDYWSDCDIYLTNNTIVFYTQCSERIHINKFTNFNTDFRINNESIRTFLNCSKNHCNDHYNFEYSTSKLVETLLKLLDNPLCV